MQDIFKIEEYSLVRVAASGNVDDGKSTLFGRLFYELGELKQDQFESLVRATRSKMTLQPDRLKYLEGQVDFSLVTDGLSRERSENITIDVAYRYFYDGSIKYILSDNPGHFGFLRNFVSGIAQAHILILVIDASKTIQEQTLRHLFLAHMFGIRKLLICINKMDLIDDSQEIFSARVGFLEEILRTCFNFNEWNYVPICAVRGVNLISNQGIISWYRGLALMEYLRIYSFDEISGGTVQKEVGECHEIQGVLDDQVYGFDHLHQRPWVAHLTELPPTQLEGQKLTDIKRGHLFGLWDSSSKIVVQAFVAKSFEYLGNDESSTSREFLLKTGFREYRVKVQQLMVRQDESHCPVKAEEDAIQRLNWDAIWDRRSLIWKPVKKRSFEENHVYQFILESENSIYFRRDLRSLVSFILIDIQSTETLAAGIIKASA